MQLYQIYPPILFRLRQLQTCILTPLKVDGEFKQVHSAACLSLQNLRWYPGSFTGLVQGGCWSYSSKAGFQHQRRQSWLLLSQWGKSTVRRDEAVSCKFDRNGQFILKSTALCSFVLNVLHMLIFFPLTLTLKTIKNICFLHVTMKWVYFFPLEIYHRKLFFE